MSDRTRPSPGALILEGLEHFAGRSSSLTRNEAGARLTQGIGPIVAEFRRPGLADEDFAQDLLLRLLSKAGTLQQWTPAGAYVFAQNWARAVASAWGRACVAAEKYRRSTTVLRDDLPGANVREQPPADHASERLESASEVAALKKVALRLILGAPPVHRPRIVALFRHRLGQTLKTGFDVGPDPQDRSLTNIYQDRSKGAKYARATLERIASTLDPLEQDLAERLLSGDAPDSALSGEEEPA